jgi:hypothetical protein
MSIGELEVGDTAQLADFRLAALKMSRLAVRPIDGVFPVITSEEHFWDLMTDPLIKDYLGSLQGMPHFKDGSLPELFGIKFIKTQFDEYAYGYELANTGEFVDPDDNVKCRVYWVDSTGGHHYANIDSAGHRKTYVAREYKSTEDTYVSGSRSMEEDNLPDYSGAKSEDQNEAYNRLSDGSWIPIRTVWDFNSAEIIAGAEVTSEPSSTGGTQVQLGDSDIWYNYDGSGTYTLYFKDAEDTYHELGTVASTTLTYENMEPVLPTVKQLPVHKAIMLGADALARLEVASEGNVKMFAKEKGSAGVLDPINQRQSIGFKINIIGFQLIRDEACWVFNHVPTQATATAGISL